MTEPTHIWVIAKPYLYTQVYFRHYGVDVNVITVYFSDDDAVRFIL